MPASLAAHPAFNPMFAGAEVAAPAGTVRVAQATTDGDGVGGDLDLQLQAGITDAERAVILKLQQIKLEQQLVQIRLQRVAVAQHQPGSAAVHVPVVPGDAITEYKIPLSTHASFFSSSTVPSADSLPQVQLAVPVTAMPTVTPTVAARRPGYADWSCASCTLINPGPAWICAACETQRV